MPTFTKEHRVAFSPAEMYALVADVERYPEFLPMCESLVVRSREDVDTGSVLTATMGVGYKTIRESFTTRVTLQPADPLILVEYLDGPFKRLENRWRFLPAPSGSIIDFYIDYEFRSALLGVLMGALFDKAFRRFTTAFEERARVVYGPRSSAGAV